MKRSIVVFVSVVALAAVGCGGGNPGLSARTTDGSCEAAYDPELGQTLVVFEVSGVGPYGVALPGDEWVVRCASSEGHFSAEREADHMSARADSVEVQIQGSVAEAIANNTNGRIERMRADGTMVQPITGIETVDERTISGSFLIGIEDRRGVMIFAESGVALPNRLVRFSISSFPEDPDRGGPILRDLALAASTFGPLGDSTDSVAQR